jgi:putative ABC transport system substrate-binding protein
MQLTHLATRHAVPAIYALHDYVEAGGLMGYGASLTHAFRQVGVFAGRSLKGSRVSRVLLLIDCRERDTKDDRPLK